MSNVIMINMIYTLFIIQYIFRNVCLAKNHEVRERTIAYELIFAPFFTSKANLNIESHILMTTIINLLSIIHPPYPWENTVRTPTPSKQFHPLLVETIIFTQIKFYT